MSVPWRLVLRHQLGSALATAVDFGLMISCVEWGGLSVVLGTGIGATVGAAINFTLGRSWIFHAGDHTIGGQVLRYALVAVGSLGLNAGGEHLGANVLGVPYVGARTIVAVLVGIFWNFPLHRWFVFGAKRVSR